MFTVTVEGVDELDRAWGAAASQLERDTDRATVAAADASVSAMQSNHPYEDQTYNLSGSMHVVEHAPRPDTDGMPLTDAVIGLLGAESADTTLYESEVVIPADYASHVNWGTKHMKARPFLPTGEREAERALTREEREAADRFERSCRG